MRADPTAAPRRRDYDRRKKRAPIKKSGRPFWRQPLLLGLVVLLLGCGGGGGWWAWREGWLVEARNRVDAIGLAIVGTGRLVVSEAALGRLTEKAVAR